MALIQCGPRNARIVMVGEAPGENEERTGLPFTGGAGEVLNNLLDRAGIFRNEVFITNICHVRPKGNDFSWFLRPPNMVHLAQGLLQLKEDISEIQPNLIVALGAYPLKVLTGKTGIEKWRGSVIESTLVPGIKVLATVHPAAILRKWEFKAVAAFDLARAREQAQFPEIVRTPRDFILNPPPQDLPALYEELYRAPILGADIECTIDSGGVWRLSCVGFAPDERRAVVVPASGHDNMAFIRGLLGSPSHKVFQNGLFDYTVLLQNGISVQGYGCLDDEAKPMGWDTMLAHHALYTECASGEDEVSRLTRKGPKKDSAAIQKGLSFLTSIYTDIPFYKDDSKISAETGDMELFWTYNARDCVSMMEVMKKQLPELHEFNTYDTFQREMRLLMPVHAATSRGIRIDFEVRERLRTKYETEIENLQAFLNAGAGKPVNVKSTPDMRWLLYDKLGLPKRYARKTSSRNPDKPRSPSADKDAINYLAERYPNPVLGAILHIRERRDLIERSLNVANDADGRIRCSFDITGTRTGRLASRASLFGSGTNLQNQTEKVREMYIPDPGYAFISRDYKQAEVWVVAYLADEKSLIELLNDPTRDVHRENAGRIFGKPLEEITEEERYLAKRGVHAADYGMQENLFVIVVNNEYDDTGVRLTLPQARRILEAYFLLYPGIKARYWKDVENELRSTRTLVNAFGRKRIFFARWDSSGKLLRDAYSFKPQSSVGDLGGMAFANCYWNIEVARPDLGAQLLLNVHDSVLMQAPIEHVEEVAAEMERQMAIPMTINGSTFVIPTDCAVGFNWRKRPKSNPSDNPRGLVDLAKYPNWREVLAA